MTLPEAIKILKRHNNWRRGKDIEMDDPKQLGIAIDTICSEREFKKAMLIAWINGVYGDIDWQFYKITKFKNKIFKYRQFLIWYNKQNFK